MLVVRSVTADRNTGATGINITAPGDVTIDPSSASHNGSLGLFVQSGAKVAVRETDATGNGAMGMSLQGVAGVAVSRSQIVNNPDGIFISGPIAGAFQLQCNNITGNTGFGLRSNSSATVAAPDNWWGSASGPTHPSNPTGTGDSVIDGANGGAGTVNFVPFLDSNWEVNPHCRFQPAPALGHVTLAACGLGLLLVGYLLTLRQRVR